MNDKTLLRAEGLRMWYPVKRGMFRKPVNFVKALDGVDLSVYAGETLGVVGESGCGKTTLGKALMMLNRPTGGSIYYNFENKEAEISQLNERELLKYRRVIQMIFQDPYSAFIPRKTILNSLEQPLIVHGVKSRAERLEIIKEMLTLVNLPIDYMNRYPHELSGGQRQRMCIARALEINPGILVCDEAVSALDVSVQAQVLNLLRSIQLKCRMTYIFIAHDLSVVQYMSDRIAVMYLGRVVELADSEELYKHPLHPYTQALFSAVPLPVLHREKRRIVLAGDVPSPINKPKGCPFHPRCRLCMEKCREIEPQLIAAGDGHQVACHITV